MSTLSAQIGATRSFVAIGVLLLAASGCGGGEGGSPSTGGGGDGGVGRGGPPAVEIVTVAPRTVTETRELTGTLAPIQEARLTSQLEGGVLRVRVEEGDRVRAGQPLVEFDATVQAAELVGAQTRARVAQAAAGRADRLLALGAASRGEQEEAAAVLREALAELRAAEARVAYGAVRSPFAGVVTAVRVDAGDVVGIRDEVVTVADLSALRAELAVSELDLVRLREGDAVRATVDALPDIVLAARIRRVFPTVDPTSRQGVLEVELPRKADALVPGLLARLTLTVEEVPKTIAVPLDAVRRDVRDRTYVYVVQDVVVPDSAAGPDGGEDKGKAKRAEDGGEKRGRDGNGAKGDEGDGSRGTRRAQIVVRRPVVIGLQGSDNWVQVRRGVELGDRVVVSGDQELSDSARVRVLPAGRSGDARRGQPVAGSADGAAENDRLAPGEAAAVSPASGSGGAAGGASGGASGGTGRSGAAPGEGSRGSASSPPGATAAPPRGSSTPPGRGGRPGG